MAVRQRELPHSLCLESVSQWPILAFLQVDWSNLIISLLTQTIVSRRSSDWWIIKCTENRTTRAGLSFGGKRELCAERVAGRNIRTNNGVPKPELLCALSLIISRYNYMRPYIIILRRPILYVHIYSGLPPPGAPPPPHNPAQSFHFLCLKTFPLARRTPPELLWIDVRPIYYTVFFF